MYVGLAALLITDQFFCSITFFGSIKKREKCARIVEIEHQQRKVACISVILMCQLKYNNCFKEVYYSKKPFSTI